MEPKPNEAPNPKPKKNLPELTEDDIKKLRELLRIIVEDRERRPLYTKSYGVFYD